jgi:hypothetical protein
MYKRHAHCLQTCNAHTFYRAARVLVMTDETFRQKFRYVLDTRVQTGAFAGMVLQMLIVPGVLYTNTMLYMCILDCTKRYNFVLLRTA